MADKNIGTFGVGDYLDITHVVAVPAQGAAVDVDPLLVPKAAFVGPKGDKGDTGDTGPQGIQGAQGPKGDKGDQGLQGVQGIQGVKGDKGDTGAQGDPGTQGADGPQGIQGPAGPAGTKGDTGERGDPGPSVIPDEYGIFNEAKVTAIATADVDHNILIVAEGDERADQTQPPALNGDMSGHLVRYETGGTWLDLGPIVGIAGPKGDKGDNGANGADGSQGPQGIQGLQGPKGDKGDKGDDGADGPQGVAGAQGAKGDPGTTLRYGEGAPGSGVGVDGEFYIDTVASEIYGPKDAGVWPSGVSLVGAQGPAGDTGATGAKGDKGDKGDPGATGATGVVPLTEITTITSLSQTLTIAHAECYLRVTVNGTKTLTVPNNTSVPFPYTANGETTTIMGINASTSGNLTIAAASGVTINKRADLTYVLGLKSAFMLIKVGTNEWDLIGDMDAA